MDTQCTHVITNTLRRNGRREDPDLGPIEAVAPARAVEEENQASAGILDDRRRADTQRAYMPIRKHPVSDTTISWRAQTPPPPPSSVVRRTQIGIIELVPSELTRYGQSSHDNNRRRSRKLPQWVYSTIPVREIGEAPPMRAASSSRRNLPTRVPRGDDRGGSMGGEQGCHVGKWVLESAPRVSRTTPTVRRSRSQSVSRFAYAAIRHKP